MAQIENKVVAHFRDGRIVKGFTYDFNPIKETFHITKIRNGKEVIEASAYLMKAVFFVKTFDGNKNHSSFDDFSMEKFKDMPGLKVKITFFDGEVIYGSTHGYSPDRKGFFIFPANKETNNERLFVIKETTDSVEIWR